MQELCFYAGLALLAILSVLFVFRGPGPGPQARGISSFSRRRHAATRGIGDRTALVGGITAAFAEYEQFKARDSSATTLADDAASAAMAAARAKVAAASQSIRMAASGLHSAPRVINTKQKRVRVVSDDPPPPKEEEAEPPSPRVGPSDADKKAFAAAMQKRMQPLQREKKQPERRPRKEREREEAAPAPEVIPTCRLAAPLAKSEAKNLEILFRVLRERQSNRWFAHGGHAISALRIGSPNMYFDREQSWPVNMDVDFDFQLIVANQSAWTQQWGPRMNELLKHAFGNSVALQSKIYPKNSYKVFRFCETNERSRNPKGHGAGNSCMAEFRPLFQINATHVSSKQQCAVPPTKSGPCERKFVFPLAGIFPLRRAKYGALALPVPKTATFVHALDLETKGLRLSARAIALWPELGNVAPVLEGCASCRATVTNKCSGIHYCPPKAPRTYYSGPDIVGEIRRCQRALKAQGFATFDLPPSDFEAAAAIASRSQTRQTATTTTTTTTGSTTTAKREAYVSLLMGNKWDLYTEVALVWAASVRRHDQARDIVIMITPDTPPANERALRDRGNAHGVQIVKIARLTPPEKVRSRKDLGDMFMKLRVFGLTQYSKIVYLDLDTLVIDPGVTSMFDHGEGKVAVINRGGRQKLNAGVMVMQPGKKEVGTSLDDMVLHFPDYVDIPKRDTTDQGWLIEYWQRHGTGLEELHQKYNFILRQQLRRKDAEYKPVVLHWPGFSNQKPWSCSYKYADNPYHTKYVDMWLSAAGGRPCEYYDELGKRAKK